MILETGATKPCPQCGKPMGANRGVCAECGNVSTWFQVRLFLGCAGLALGFLGMLAVLLLALFGGAH